MSLCIKSVTVGCCNRFVRFRNESQELVDDEGDKQYTNIAGAGEWIRDLMQDLDRPEANLFKLELLLVGIFPYL